MPVYLDIVMLMNFLVDFFLLLGTNRLSGYPTGMGRAATAALLGGVYGGACLLPGFRFLGNTLWRMVSLGLMGIIAFGADRGTLRRCVLFVLLSMALGGVALYIGGMSFPSLVSAAGGVFLLCLFGFRGRAGNSYIPVVLEYGGECVQLTALHDTGNTLRDPLTGESVLIADPKTANRLLGLTVKELEDPVSTVTVHPGLRLIPYRTVGKDHGLLLGLRIPRAKVGNRTRSLLVAFASEGLGGNGVFDALIGGME